MTDAERAALKEFYELNKMVADVDDALEAVEWNIRDQNIKKADLLRLRAERCEKLQRAELAVRAAVRAAVADVTS